MPCGRVSITQKLLRLVYNVVLSLHSSCRSMIRLDLPPPPPPPICSGSGSCAKVHGVGAARSSGGLVVGQAVVALVRGNDELL
ncbi:hypothetical protein PVAP13_4NG322680 [Panicum virgatum]|uniref:Uncharacterized protein n=1 Tax=Panicum virgatum TaxID=38727 RepID=A0A8T0TFX4_PANVG|nr:hypothetical protein PVAP13_4NG322680 [Panicum virgatum]